MTELEPVPNLEIFTFGGLVVRRGGETLTSLGSRKAEGLLVYLAVNGRATPRDVLAELFWPEREPKRAQGNLRRVLYDLKRRLEPYLTIDRDSIAIQPDRVRVDVTQLQDQLAAIDQQGGLTSLETVTELETAVALYQGPFLHGFPTGDSRDFESWLWALQEQLEQQVMSAMQQLVGWHLTFGPFERGLPHAGRLLQLDPFRETSLRQLLRLLVYNGQQTEALARYETGRQLLWDELGVEPERETAALFQQIVDGELEVPELAQMPVKLRPATLPAFLETAEAPFDLPVFVAREGQLSALAKHLEQGLAGQGKPLFLSGEPGAGKTAIATAFARRAEEAQPELLVAWGVCQAHTGSGDPYQPFRALLAMLTGDVEAAWSGGLISGQQATQMWQTAPLTGDILMEQGPDLLGRFVAVQPLLQRMKTAVAPDQPPWLEQLEAMSARDTAGWEEDQQAQFFEQFSNVLQFLSRERPLLLILDDLQWADAASLDLLFHLNRNLGDGRICLIGTYRSDEVALGRRSHISGQMERHPLQKLLDESQRSFGEVILELDVTDTAEGIAFINAFLDSEPNRFGAGFRQTLAQHTGGQPLFTVELLQALQERGDLTLDESGMWVEGENLDWALLPAKVEGVIGERIGRLEEELHETLRVASVEGEIFTAQVVARVREVADRGLVRQLSRELDRKHRLVGERGPQQVGERRLYRFRFRHNLFQQHLYNRLGEMERELLHGEVGQVLERLYAGREGEIAAQLAHHFSQGRRWKKMLHYLGLAGEQAARLFAQVEALSFYNQAVELVLDKGDILSEKELAPLRTKRGEVFALMGDFEAAIDDMTYGLRAAQEKDDLKAQLNLLTNLGMVYRRFDDYKKGLELLEQAVEVARRSGDPHSLANTIYHLGSVVWSQGENERAFIALQEALEICRAEGIVDLVAVQATHGLAEAYWIDGKPNAALDLFKESLELSRQIGDRSYEAENLQMMATIYSGPVNISDYESARQAAEAALEICQDAGFDWHMTPVLHELGNAHRGAGDYQQAHDKIFEAIDKANEIGALRFLSIHYGLLGLFYQDLNLLDRAYASFERAEQICEEIDSTWSLPRIKAGLGIARIRQGDLSVGPFLEEALSFALEQGQKLYAADCYEALLEFAVKAGHFEQAFDYSEKLMAMAKRGGLNERMVQGFRWRGLLQLTLGQFEKAGHDLHKAADLAKEIGSQRLLWEVNESLAQFYRSQGDEKRTTEYERVVKSIVSGIADSLDDETLKTGLSIG